MRRGFGQVSLGPLGQATFSGQINPVFEPAPAWVEAGFLTTAPQMYYMSPSSAAQIAALLGGSVVSCNPGGGQPTSNGCIQMPNGQVFNPGPSWPPGVILDYGSECDVENALLQSIPDSVLSSTCAGGGTGETDTQLALANSGLTQQQQQIACNTIGGCTMQTPIAIVTPTTGTPGGGSNTTIPTSFAPVTTTGGGGSNTTIPTSFAPLTTGGGTNTTIPSSLTPPGPSQIVNSTPGSNAGGSNAGNVGSNAGSNSNTNTNVVSACFNPLNAWVSDSCAGPMGLFEWGIIAALALWLFMPKGR
jgi:hypothetical protein